MKTTLAKTWQIDSLYRQLLTQNKVILNHRILPFSAWLKNNSTLVSEEYLFLKAFSNIQKFKEDMVLCKPLVSEPSFVAEVVQFYTTLVEYQIALDDLPTTTALHKELKILLAACSSLITPYHQRAELMNTDRTFPSVEITEECIDSLSLSDFVKKKELTIIRRHKVEQSTINFYKALNIRQEIEACAQLIVREQLQANDINIVLCAYQDSIPYLKLIFDRYQIPYALINEHANSKVVDSFYALASWLHQPTITNFKNLISTSLLNNIDYTSTLNYIDLFIEDLDLNKPATHVQHHVSEVEYLASFQQSYLLELEKAFEHTRITLLGLLKNINPNNCLEMAYDVLRYSNLILNKEEASCLISIQSFLNNIDPSELNDTKIAAILYQIKAITIVKSDYDNQRVMITDLNHPLISRDNLFVLNANSKHYPGSCALSGLFEENYVALIDKFPTPLERANFFNQKQRWIERDAKRIVLSYATNTFEGKGLECSFEIKQMAKCEAVDWPLIQNNHFYTRSHPNLSCDSAMKLFVEDNQIKGSVSSFEKHFKCPYSYFLYSGLKLRKANEVSFDQAMVGSIQHACIEEALKLYPKNYTSISLEQLSNLVQHKFSSVELFFTKQRWLIQSVKERCIESLMMQFRFLKDFEEHSSLNQHQSEVPFEMTFFKGQNITILLRGIIDRIDYNTNSFRVVDFKSSLKKLKMSTIQDGTQLQLLTYLFAALTKIKKECLGIYYHSLKNENISVDAAKLSLRPFDLILYDDEHYFDEWLKAHRLNGVTTSTNNENDDNGKHIVGWNQKGISESKIKETRYLLELLNTLYRMLRKHLLEGKITCTPVEGACLFCDYKNICLYQGRSYIKNISEEELKEVEEHAKVEPGTI